MSLDFINLEKYRTREKIISEFKDDKKPVVIFGTGKFAISVAEVCLENDINVTCFVDNPKYWYKGKYINVDGNIIACILETELTNFNSEYNILAGNVDYSLVKDIMQNHPECNQIDYLDVYEPHVIQFDFLEKNSKLIEEIYNNLCDQESKDVLEAFLHARYTGDITRICELNHSREYLYDWQLLNVSINDTFVDGGAYIGDSILELKKFNGFLPKHIFAFEPDSNNLIQLLSNFSAEDLMSIHTIPAGLYDNDCKLSFSSSGTLGSSISDEGNCIVNVQALDFHDAYKSTSVIKLDVEGAELKTLFGAIELIRTNRPRMAICIYHHNEDILELFNFLKEFNYKLYLRQHANCCEETVLYAI